MAKLLKKALRIRYVYTGDIFRQMADEKEMTVTEFGDYVAEHPEIDRALDQKQAELAQETDIIIEGRLAGYIAYRYNIAAYKIWLHAPPEIRASRVAGRERKSVDMIMKENDEREEGNRSRYMDIYGFDINHTSFYDINIDSSRYLPEDIKAMIIRDMVSKGIIKKSS